jgi:RND family efflux transporter MFP subunit
MFRLNALSLLVVALAVGGLTGCGGRAQTSSATGAPNSNSNSGQPIAIRVYQVATSVARGDLLIPAALSIEGVALVTSQRDGAISQLRVQEGSRVTKGEVVARLSGDDDLRAQLRQAELEVNRLQVEQSQLEALIKLDRNEFEREKILAKDGLSSQSQVEHAQFKFEASSLELQKSRVASQSAQSKADAVKAELKKTVISSPISGVVTHRYIELGSSVARNEKLLEISPASPLQVKFQLPQAERATLGPGSVVGISLIDGDAVVASARVRRIQPEADAASNTFGYVADVIGGRGLVPGLAVNVRVPRSVSSPNLLVPQSAFPANSDLRRGTAATLFVVDGDRCAVRSVWVNSIDGDQIEIVSGLSAGDRVILSPPAQLKAGDFVAVTN